jgi:hypothetical protein
MDEDSGGKWANPQTSVDEQRLGSAIAPDRVGDEGRPFGRILANWSDAEQAGYPGAWPSVAFAASPPLILL